jgi:electron transfer flavoprotein beta subunit
LNMNIAVCVKRVSKIDDDIEFINENTNVDPDYLDFALNEWDAVALSEALRIRDLDGLSKVFVLTVGGPDDADVLVQGLAMGADQAIRVNVQPEVMQDPLTIGRLLGSAIASIEAELVLCGAQSLDSAQGATASAVAGALGFACATVVTKVEPSGQRLRITRELEGGVTEFSAIELPSVLSIQTGTIVPRYVTLRAIQSAKQAPIEVLDLKLNHEITPGYVIRSLSQPTKRVVELNREGAPAVALKILELIREVKN